VRLILDIEQPLPKVIVQPIQIEQVILNLARNAIEALTELDQGERLLYIGTKRQAGGVIHLWVRDNGPGIKPELESTLFDPFVTGKPDGMGLGLSISYGIIEAHGGKLSINSDYRDGAEFSFNLPIGEVA
jgi:two-component system sensor histidine kinase TtrS